VAAAAAEDGTEGAAEGSTENGSSGDPSAAAPPPVPPPPVAAAAIKYSSRKVFQFVHEIVGALASSGYPDLSLKLFLQVKGSLFKRRMRAAAVEVLGCVLRVGLGLFSACLSLASQCAMAADSCDFKAIAYEFMSQASILYEDELTDSKAQVG
jgi:vacuolar protein sorting-associated protein 35